jgi:DNA-directed RNA polymerase specialized sigma24 family protein
MPIDSSDEQLVNRLRHGDERAIEELVAKHWHRITSSLWKSGVKNSTIVLDTYAELLVIVWKKGTTLDPIKGHGSMSPWLCKVAKQVAVALWRQRQRSPEVQLSDFRYFVARPNGCSGSEIPPSSRGLSPSWEMKARDEAVTFIANLTPKDRDILCADKTDTNWTVPIAHNHGIKANTVSQRRRRLEQRFKRHIFYTIGLPPQPAGNNGIPMAVDPSLTIGVADEIRRGRTEMRWRRGPEPNDREPFRSGTCPYNA